MIEVFLYCIREKKIEEKRRKFLLQETSAVSHLGSINELVINVALPCEFDNDDNDNNPCLRAMCRPYPISAG